MLHIRLLRLQTWSDDLFATDPQGQNAFMLACQSGQTKTVQWFLDNSLEKLDIDARDNDGNTAFMMACEHGQYEIVELFFVEIC